jgi:hypothetical protein
MSYPRNGTRVTILAMSYPRNGTRVTILAMSYPRNGTRVTIPAMAYLRNGTRVTIPAMFHLSARHSSDDPRDVPSLRTALECRLRRGPISPHGTRVPFAERSHLPARHSGAVFEMSHRSARHSSAVAGDAISSSTAPGRGSRDTASPRSCRETSRADPAWCHQRPHGVERRSRAHAPDGGVTAALRPIPGWRGVQVKARGHGASWAGGCARTEPRWTPGRVLRELVTSEPAARRPCAASARGCVGPASPTGNQARRLEARDGRSVSASRGSSARQPRSAT